MHFERGRDFARAVECLVQSGDNAAELYANAEAAEHYGHAISLVEKLPEEDRAEKLLTLYQRRGKSSMALGRFGQAVNDFTEMLDAARQLGSPEQESVALATLGEGIEIAGRYGDQFWLPRMPNCVGWLYRELQDFEQAIRYDQQGLDIGRRMNVLEAQANSLINLGIDHRHTGDGERTTDAFNEVENIFQRDMWFRWRYNIRLQAGTCEPEFDRRSGSDGEGELGDDRPGRKVQKSEPEPTLSRGRGARKFQTTRLGSLMKVPENSSLIPLMADLSFREVEQVF